MKLTGVSMKDNDEKLQKDPAQIFYEKLCDPEYLNRNLERAIQNSFAKGVPVVQADEKGTMSSIQMVPRSTLQIQIRISSL